MSNEGTPSRSGTTELTTGQAIVRYLQVQYSERDGERQRLVPRMLGIFGHGNVAGLGQGLDEYGDDLPFIQGRNEQSMVHVAAGYARATRRRSTLACTTSIGPGSTNMVTGAAGATINRLPVLLFPSDTYATRHQGPVLQQLEHPVYADVSVNDCFRPVSRFFDRISRPEQLLTALPEAMRVLTSPTETGAVVIALPQDVQAQAYPYPSHFFEERTWRIERPAPDGRRIAEAVQLLAQARRPVIIAGGGVRYSEAERELAGFASRFGIPVTETFSGKGVIAEDDWYSLGGGGVEGNAGANQILGEADVVLAIGTRLTDFATASHTLFRRPDVRFVTVNVVERDAHKEGALPIVADAREALRALASAAEGAGIAPADGYKEEIRRAKAGWVTVQEGATGTQPSERTISSAQQIAALNAAAEAGDTVVAAAGLPAPDLLKFWDATGDRRCHLEFGYSCMGYEIPGALGVRMAQRDGEVFVYVGDGTFLLNPGDLATALQEDLKLIVVVPENHGFQSIARLQVTRTSRLFGNEFRSREKGRLDGPYLELDLAKVAEGLGAVAMRATNAEEFAQTLKRARGESRTCVIVCATDPHQYLPTGGCWWDLEVAEVSSLPEVRALRDEYERERTARRRFYY